jgi:hypothetical protein
LEGAQPPGDGEAPAVYGYSGAKADYGLTPVAEDEPVVPPGAVEYPNLTFYVPDADQATPETPAGSQGFGFVTLSDGEHASAIGGGLRSDGELVQAVSDDAGGGEASSSPSSPWIPSTPVVTSSTADSLPTLQGSAKPWIPSTPVVTSSTPPPGHNAAGQPGPDGSQDVAAAHSSGAEQAVEVRGWDPDEKKAIIGEQEGDTVEPGLAAADGPTAEEGINQVDALTLKMKVPEDDGPNALVDLTSESPGLTPIHENHTFEAALPDDGDVDGDEAPDDDL